MTARRGSPDGKESEGVRHLPGLLGAIGAVCGLAVAAVVLFACAWVLSWPITWAGLQGSDSAYHLHLANWVSTTFPNLAWWYRWDGMGMSYREGYPLLPSWLVVALADARHWTNAQAMQVIQFLINPLCALGLYAYGALRMRNPLVGLLAGILYMLSPIVFTFLVDWGFFANQVGTVLVLPALIALDIFWEEWQEGRRGWRFRLSGAATIALISLTGLISPTIFGAPLAVIALYTFACHGWRGMARWLFVVTPALLIVIGGLSAFWGLTLFDALRLSAGRAPAATYNPQLSPHWDLQRMLELLPARPGHVEDRVAFVPAAWVPGLLGMFGAVFDRRVRVILAMAGLGFVITSFVDFDRWLFGTPVLDVLNNRAGLTLVQFAVPLLGAYGLAGVLPALASVVSTRLRARSTWRSFAVATAVVIGLLLSGADLAVYASSRGPVDLWQRHVDNPCGGGSTDSQLCGTALAAQFNVLELNNACSTPSRQLRTEVEVCADLGSVNNPRWDPANDGAIARLVDRCRSTGDAYDQVCRARLGTFIEQALDLSQWRPFQVGCYPPACGAASAPASLSGSPAPRSTLTPDRAVLDAHSGRLLMAFHDATGGGQFYTYYVQGIPSPELDDFMKGAMLDQSGEPALKAELAAITGSDAVVLAPGQSAVAADYAALGWRQTSSDPVVYVPPSPSGLAAQRSGGGAVLVIGQLAAAPSHPYNDLFERAAQGMIPFSAGWLVRPRSAFVDDYSDAELSGYSALVLVGYQYHDAGTAWQRLDHYVRNGGRLFVETGWQYVDPDWNASSSHSVLPVGSLGWSALDPAAPVSVEGAADPLFGGFTYQGGGWGASSAPGVRPGAEPLVQVGGRVVAARWSVGKGRVVWSGMNLIAHAETAQSDDEYAFLARQFAWLLESPAGSPGSPVSPDTPTWVGNDEAQIPLTASSGPTSVLFKESMAPGWSAELQWPGGSHAVTIEPAEIDFMLVRLPSVPAGSMLVFHYGPTWQVYLWWAASAITLFLLVIWVAAPAPYRWAWARVIGITGRLRERVRSGWESE